VTPKAATYQAQFGLASKILTFSSLASHSSPIPHQAHPHHQEQGQLTAHPSASAVSRHFHLDSPLPDNWPAGSAGFWYFFSRPSHPPLDFPLWILPGFLLPTRRTISCSHIVSLGCRGVLDFYIPSFLVLDTLPFILLSIATSAAHSIMSSRQTERDRRAAAAASARTNEYFVPRDGIDREVITADICRYLGNDALVRPGNYEVSQRSARVG
jgi:hypothetical protein